jgi:hypothetical protein
MSSEAYEAEGCILCGADAEPLVCPESYDVRARLGIGYGWLNYLVFYYLAVLSQLEISLVALDVHGFDG